MRKKIIFDEEELFAVAVFDPDTRLGTIDMMERALKELSDDADMRALVVSAKEKLKLITDKDFKDLDLQAFRDDMEWDEEEAE